MENIIKHLNDLKISLENKNDDTIKYLNYLIDIVKYSQENSLYLECYTDALDYKDELEINTTIKLRNCNSK